MQEGIRPARAEDRDAIVATVRAAYAHYIALIGREPQPMYDDYESRIVDGVVFVVFAEDALCGVIVLIEKDDALLIENVAVAPAVQGRGIGRRLLTFAEDEALKRGKRAVTLYTNEVMTENLALYGHLGYDVTGRAVMSGYRRIHMKKTLQSDRRAEMTPDRVPDVTFHTRVRNDALEGPNPFEWKDVTTAEIFAGKTVVLFAVPGAFTPACSDTHLPGFEAHYAEFEKLGVDAVVCLSVNDAFVLFQWAKSRNIEKISMLPDGNGEFTEKMGMLVERSDHGMGRRSWRYSMLVEDGAITKMFVEPGFRDNPPGVGVAVSNAETMLEYLRQR